MVNWLHHWCWGWEHFPPRAERASRRDADKTAFLTATTISTETWVLRLRQYKLLPSCVVLNDVLCEAFGLIHVARIGRAGTRGSLKARSLTFALQASSAGPDSNLRRKNVYHNWGLEMWFRNWSMGSTGSGDLYPSTAIDCVDPSSNQERPWLLGVRWTMLQTVAYARWQIRIDSSAMRGISSVAYSEGEDIVPLTLTQSTMKTVILDSAQSSARDAFHVFFAAEDISTQNLSISPPAPFQQKHDGHAAAHDGSQALCSSPRQFAQMSSDNLHGKQSDRLLTSPSWQSFKPSFFISARQFKLWRECIDSKMKFYRRSSSMWLNSKL